MVLIDNRGRLFGKVSIIDLGAVLIVAIAVAAVFLFPGNQAASVVSGNRSTQAVEVDIMARRVSLRSMDIFEPGSRANLIIRNQPYGQVEVMGVEDVSRKVPVVLPNGEIQRLAEEAYSADIVLTIAGNASITDDGVVLGNSKVKVGVPIEIETFDYLVRGSVMDVRILDAS
ncbi:DUF4330 domain-containing protein [Synechococcus sp. PCC 7336]|uniref:DUF4330 domain-containing protein n=1 Tax=Synechococcus sp. PCC 7336 TaxID=195250 RepID=UPI00034B536E|nr:DUF4330 domain-containing protein [Synechococcus sp. PCC 7336]